MILYLFNLADGLFYETRLFVGFIFTAVILGYLVYEWDILIGGKVKSLSKKVFAYFKEVVHEARC